MLKFLRQSPSSEVPGFQTILITGASQGIGAELALLYAKKNVNLILVARNLLKLEQIKERCLQRGAQVITKSIDIANARQLSEFINDVDNQMPIDLVIANAGVANTLRPDWQQEEKLESDYVMQVNVLGTWNTLDPVMKKMINRKRGQIALMSSLAGLRGLPHSPTYSASKAALYSYGQSLRSWLKRYNIQVSIICPGYVQSSMSNQLEGPKPFLMTSKKAAQIIKKGLSKNKPCIAFPKSLYYVTKLSNYVPVFFVDFILNRYESYRK